MPATMRSGNTGLSTHSISDSTERLVLSVMRHLCASLASEGMRGWECAHDLAEAALGLSDGPALVAHVAALLRAVRAERQQGFAYMSADCPMCSLRITDEELLIVRLLRAARSDARQKVVQIAAALAQRNAAPRIAGAGLVLANRLAAFAVVSEPPAATGRERAGSGGVFPSIPAKCPLHERSGNRPGAFASGGRHHQ